MTSEEPEPWWWRLVRAGAASLAVGLVTLGCVLIVETLLGAAAYEAPLGKREYVGGAFAGFAFLWFVLQPPSRTGRSAWGFVRPLAVVGALAYFDTRVALVVPWIPGGWDRAMLPIYVVIYLGLVPFASWRVLFHRAGKSLERTQGVEKE